MQVSNSYSELLVLLEQQLKQSGLWQQQPTTAEALSSGQPFALDTLSPQQWLQWIFIPRVSQMLNNGEDIKGFCISPYFEEVWKSQKEKAELIETLQAIDKVDA